MQDKYAGDVGDFGKFVLLRQLAKVGGEGLRLGINWYRVTLPEPGNNDGRHIGYLDQENQFAPGFRTCDPDLLSKLRRIVKTGERSVKMLEESRLLPDKTLYFSRPLHCDRGSRNQRIAAREDWLKDSLASLATADVIFLDPDNGIQPASLRKTQSRSVKYAFEEEVCGYIRDHSLVIVYNHRDRSPKEKYLRKFSRVCGRCEASTSVRLLHFKRFSARDYVFYFRRNTAGLVARLFDTLTVSPMNLLFDEIPVDES